MKKILEISQAYMENYEQSIRICSDIRMDEIEYKLWFEVEDKYKEFITTEKLDAFFIAILPYAIKHEMDIHIDGKISEKLNYQMTTYLIPMLCEGFGKRVIKVETGIDSNTYNKKSAVGTGVSCGIDSFYTIKTHSNRKEENYNITHLTFFNAGASGQYGGEEARKLYKERMKFARRFAEENGFEFVSVDTNMNEFLMMNHEKTHTFRSLACVLILQKLFSKYYYSSGVNFEETRIDEHSTACYDILNMQCLSTEDITFYSTGLETNRLGKVKEITEYKPSYKFLSVCVKEDHNCGICEKCIRTLLELDAIDKLDLYKNVFDIDKFKKDRNKHLIFMLKRVREKKSSYVESYEEYKKRNKRIPLRLRIISYIPTNKQDFKNIIFKFIPKEKIKKIIKGKNKINDGWLD